MDDKFIAFRSKRHRLKVFPQSIITLVLSLTLCLAVIYVMLNNKINLEKTLMEQIALEKSIKINEVLSKLLYKTQVLSALVIQNDGEIANFEEVAAMIVDDPSILNVLLAPEGIVTNVYPKKGNEALLGYNLLGEGSGNREAILAKETGELVFGGPFDLKQGGQGLVGRLPVLIQSTDGELSFWGLVSVTLKFPEILNGIGLETLEKQGLAYKIWRISPDTGNVQLITSSNVTYNEQTRFVEKSINILNAEWTFCVYPVREWYQRVESWLMIFAGLCISCLFAFVVQNNNKLAYMQVELEEIARTDSLTQIFNRHSFMEFARMQCEKSARSHKICYVVIFDLDHFKNVNDKFGHQTGDEVLKAITKRAKNIIRSYDLLARYGGEEFIIFLTDIEKHEVQTLVGRILQSISNPPIEYNGNSVTITASFGIASVSATSELDAAIGKADKALYRAKDEGRNRIAFYENS